MLKTLENLVNAYTYKELNSGEDTFASKLTRFMDIDSAYNSKTFESITRAVESFHIENTII